MGGVPWANLASEDAEHDTHDTDVHDSDAAGEPSLTELDAAAQDATHDPTNLDPDARPDVDMIGTDGKRIADRPAPDASHDDTLPHRAQMESTFGEDLGGITVERGKDLSHLDAEAAADGDRVAFADADPSPGLVAHELTHVLQQRRAGGSSANAIAPEDSAAEHEAERNEQEVEAGADRVAAVSAPPSGRVHLSRRRRRRRSSRERIYAKEDRYNRRGVRANHKRRGKRDLDRAGVRVGAHSDVWKLDGDTADRYRIVNGNVAERVDTIRDNVEIAINPARVRQLVIPNVGPTDCCFVWARGRGAAWLPISSLAGALDARIKSATNARADAWRPAAHPGATDVWHFAVGGTSRQPNNEWVRPNTGSIADRIQDYLEKTVDTVSNGNGGRRTYFNVMMNLPQHNAAPVAIDFGQPNDLFFVVRGMEREIALWGANERRTPTAGRQRWVFGYLASNGNPDRTRRGWVPKRVLRRGPPR